MIHLLAVLIQVAPVPAVPRPPAENIAAASLLWADHAPSESTKQMVIDSVVAEATNEALYNAGVQASRKLSVTKAYLVKYDRLKPLIARHVPKDRRQLDTAIAECAMGEVARLLSPAEIAEVRRSLSTSAGQRFWQAAGLAYWPLLACYRANLELAATDADYRAVGLRPPKPPKQPKPGTMIWG